MKEVTQLDRIEARTERLEKLLTELVQHSRCTRIRELNAAFRREMEEGHMDFEERETAILLHEERLLQIGKGFVPIFGS